jgi:hypothetical protein
MSRGSPFVRIEPATEWTESALDWDHEIQKGRRPCGLELALDGFVDNLLDVRATATASQPSARRARHITSRTSALFDEATNLSVGDSAAMANEHRISLLEFLRTPAVYFHRK